VQLRRQGGEVVQRSGLLQHASGPADAGRHRRVAFHQVDAADGVGRGRVGRGLLAGQHVTVGVPAQHADTGQAAQPVEYLGRAGAEQDEVAQHPPAVHVMAGRVVEHRPQLARGVLIRSGKLPDDQRVEVFELAACLLGRRAAAQARRHQLAPAADDLVVVIAQKRRHALLRSANVHLCHPMYEVNVW